MSKKGGLIKFTRLVYLSYFVIAVLFWACRVDSLPAFAEDSLFTAFGWLSLIPIVVSISVVKRWRLEPGVPGLLLTHCIAMIVLAMSETHGRHLLGGIPNGIGFLFDILFYSYWISALVIPVLWSLRSARMVSSGGRQ